MCMLYLNIIVPHSVGLENIYYLTRLNRRLSVFLEDHDGETRVANYSLFYVDGADAEYKLQAHVIIMSTCYNNDGAPTPAITGF